MASSAFLLITIVLAVFTVPSALALNLLGKDINALNLAGVVSCPVVQSTLNQAPALLAGLPVELRCGSVSTGTLLKTVTTDAAGCYLFALNLIDYLLFDPATCYISINIASTASCTLPVPTAILKQPIVAVNVVTTELSSILGLIGGLLSGLLGGLLGLGSGTGNLLTCIGGPLSLVTSLV